MLIACLESVIGLHWNRCPSCVESAALEDDDDGSLRAGSTTSVFQPSRPAFSPAAGRLPARVILRFKRRSSGNRGMVFTQVQKAVVAAPA